MTMNPHARKPLSLASLVHSTWRNRMLIVEMTKRDVIGRYKGSIMGVLWSLLNPLFLLLMYTFVFSVVFKARWGTGGSDSKSEFAILLFVGMIVHGLFTEIMNKSPTLILANISYVKKIVFPLEILSIVATGAALFHALVSVTILLLAFLAIHGHLQWTLVFLPLVLLPLIILALGVSWILASLGVFLRDVAHPVAMLSTILLFASPVFYPITALPAFIQPWLMLNPLTFILEQARAVLIFGQLPDWTGLALYSLVAVPVAWAGYVWFQKTRKGFANVL
jgi:lipopolysaccharide transport system permease protein